jgi:cytochrome c oxidase subunit 4
MSNTETTEHSDDTPPSSEPGPVVKTDEHEGGTSHAHPTEKDYVKVAIFLAVVTGIEVVVYGIKSLETLLPYILVAASLIKFVTVVLWFMHLRFDSRLFRRLFVLGMILAIFVYGVFLTTMQAWSER